MRKLRVKNSSDREMQGLVNGDLTTLELCCSPTLPSPQLIPSPRNFQTRIQKKHSNQVCMSSSSLQRYSGLSTEQPQGCRHDAGEGVPWPGGVSRGVSLTALCSPYRCRADTTRNYTPEHAVPAETRQLALAAQGAQGTEPPGPCSHSL